MKLTRKQILKAVIASNKKQQKVLRAYKKKFGDYTFYKTS